MQQNTNDRRVCYPILSLYQDDLEYLDDENVDEEYPTMYQDLWTSLSEHERKSVAMLLGDSLCDSGNFYRELRALLDYCQAQRQVAGSATAQSNADDLVPRELTA
jgi:hypothetical protein